MKTLKKLFLTLAVVIMAVVCFAFGAWALEETGKCGYNVTYTYNSTTKELVISGIGDMTDYQCGKSPFYSGDIDSVVIENGVTTIGDYVFSNCHSLENIIIPNSVRNIGEYAFAYCQGLESVTIVNSVTSIGSHAFHGCYGLGSVIIPNSVTCIGSGAFYGKTVIYCNKNTFAESYATSKDYKYVYIDGTDEESIFSGKVGKFNWNLDKRIGVLELTGSGDMIDFTSVAAPWDEHRYYVTSLKLPDTLTKIGSNSFENFYRLSDITIPDGVTSIGSSAFEWCDNITSVTIPDSVTSIGSDAFYGCSLESITIPDSVTSIGSDAFEYCTSLKSVIFTLDEKNQSKITSMPRIYGSNVKEIVLPASIKTIGYHIFPSTIEKVTVYNPNCEFNSSCGLGYTHTIIGFKGSTAEKFADEIGAEFIDIETVHTHSYKTVETVKATCKAAGKTVGRCTCGKEKTTTLAKLAHKETTVKGKAATCTSTGLTEGKKCSVCGTVTVAQKTVAKKAHTYTTTTNKATLSKNGKTETKCTVCGKVSKTTTVYYPKTITLSASSYTYNGKTKTPTVTVKDSKGKELKKDTDYTVKYESGRKSTGKYTVTVTFKGKYSGTKKLYFTITPKTTSKVTATQTTTSVTLKWSKVTGATGYRVFQRVNGKWKTLTNTTKLTYTVKKLKAGTAYTFAVRPYTVDGKDTILASTFTQLKTATKCKAPTLKVTSSKKGVASLSWTNVAGESGYQVYYSTQKDGEYKKVKSYKTDVVTASKSKLISGKTYYFKIRAYKKTDSGTVYGTWSAVKSIKIK